MSHLHEICIVSRLTPFLERDLGTTTILSFWDAGTNAAADLVTLTCLSATTCSNVTSYIIRGLLTFLMLCIHIHIT
jgi:hypothetical protein